MRLGAPAEPVRRTLLLRKRLDDVDADDRLFRHRCQVGKSLLDIPHDRMRGVAVPVCDVDNRRRDGEGDEGQLPVEHEQDRRDPDDRQHMLHQENQAIAEKEPHVLKVDGRP